MIYLTIAVVVLLLLYYKYVYKVDKLEDKPANKIIFMRHGLRLDIADPVAWKSSERIKTHFNDIPLYNKNELEIVTQTNKLLLSKNIKAIYTSPIARCIQTALLISSTIGNVPVYVEYGLTELLTDDRDDTETRNGIVYQHNVDAEMMPDRLKSRFSNSLIFDRNITDPASVPFSLLNSDQVNLMNSIIRNIKKYDEVSLIVGHAGTVNHGVRYYEREFDIDAKMTDETLTKYVYGNSCTGVAAILNDGVIGLWKNGEKRY